MWKYTGKKRPDFASVPGPGQESVWDYPRPPALVPDGRLVEVYHADDLKSNCKFININYPKAYHLRGLADLWEGILR